MGSEMCIRDRFSDSAEFIYGDGTYSNISSKVHDLYAMRVVIALTPNIAIVWSNPPAYTSKPTVKALQVDSTVVSMVNEATQIYSKDYLFYRNDKPELIDAFKIGEHRIFAERENRSLQFINSLIEDHSRHSGFRKIDS